MNFLHMRPVHRDRKAREVLEKPYGPGARRQYIRLARQQG